MAHFTTSKCLLPMEHIGERYSLAFHLIHLWTEQSRLSCITGRSTTSASSQAEANLELLDGPCYASSRLALLAESCHIVHALFTYVVLCHYTCGYAPHSDSTVYPCTECNAHIPSCSSQWSYLICGNRALLPHSAEFAHFTAHSGTCFAHAIFGSHLVVWGLRHCIAR